MILYFAEVGRDILRVDLGLLNKRGEIEDDLRLLMKSVSSKSGSTAPPLQEISKVGFNIKLGEYR